MNITEAQILLAGAARLLPLTEDIEGLFPTGQPVKSVQRLVRALEAVPVHLTETSTKDEVEDEWYNVADLLWGNKNDGSWGPGSSGDVDGVFRVLHCIPSIRTSAMEAGNEAIAVWDGAFRMFHDAMMRALADVHPSSPVPKPDDPSPC